MNPFKEIAGTFCDAISEWWHSLNPLSRWFLIACGVIVILIVVAVLIGTLSGCSSEGLLSGQSTTVTRMDLTGTVNGWEVDLQGELNSEGQRQTKMERRVSPDTEALGGLAGMLGLGGGAGAILAIVGRLIRNAITNSENGKIFGPPKDPAAVAAEKKLKELGKLA